jgi:hypothetical protein
MKTINLLPKKPFLQVWFIPLIVGLTAVNIIIGAAVAYGAHVMKVEQQFYINEADRMFLDMRDLRRDKVQDPKLALFQNYQAVISVLEQRRIDWFPLVDSITSNLPPVARIKSITYEDEHERIQLGAEFQKLEDVAQYVRSLQASDVFEDVAIRDLSSKTALVPRPASQAATQQEQRGSVNIEQESVNQTYYEVTLDVKIRKSAKGGEGK